MEQYIDATIFRNDYRSDEEFYFAYYLQQLKEVGFITQIEYEPHTFTLLEPVKGAWIKQMKTKEKEMEYHIMDGMSYTPDWKITWSKTAEGIFLAEKPYQRPTAFPFIVPEGLEGWVDVKGKFSSYDAMRRFSFAKRLMWDKHKVYVQAIVVPKIFTATFAPERWHYAPRTGDWSTAVGRHDYRELNQYLDEIDQR